MPAPFRDRRRDEPALAGFLTFTDEESGGIRGALFIVNDRGEPVSFTFSRIDPPSSFLWRAGEARRHAIASLAAALLQACPETPALLLAAASETPPATFSEDLAVGVPLCLVGESGPVWIGRPPERGAPGQRLLEALRQRDLLLEPFDRAATGLDEAYRGSR